MFTTNDVKFKDVATFWQAIEVKLVRQVPLSTSRYVVVVVRLVPKLLTVIVALADVAVNLYHTPFVVVEVAPPQAPVGDAFVAPCKSPVVVTQAIEGVRLKAVEQELCEYIIAGKQIQEKNKMTVNPVDRNMVLKGFFGNQK